MAGHLGCSNHTKYVLLKRTSFNFLLNYFLAIILCHEIFNAQNVDANIHTNEFAVHIPGDNNVVNEVAEKYGFINKGQIGSLKGYYLFEHHDVQKRSISPSVSHSKILENDPSVLWFEQQKVKKRVKRHVSDGAFSGFRDPLYQDQWFLHGGGYGGYDMNVIPAWKQGYTGKGIVVSILDDGIQSNHPDLAQNYDKDASTDINDSDDDPTPQDDEDNKHGTRCAGEVAAVANNEFCGVGIAYNSSIGGVRMLDGSVTDSIEATALSLRPNHIHIYSASWGPEDDGKTVDGPGNLAEMAFQNGINEGRGGLGSIFVWASGNGGRHSDSCNCDGYTNSIYTISVSSATQGGFMPWYLEQCSSTLATTYSSGTAIADLNIVTVDVDYSYLEELRRGLKPNPSNLCTKSHTGTSASAPIAAAICALALEAQPKLTWRDMQYLIIMTSRYEPLNREAGWVTNGVGRKVSTKFGYGLMDAAAMVQLAKKWKTVPKQHVCSTPPDVNERIIPAGRNEKVEASMKTSGCKNTKNAVLYLEHVQVKITLNFYPRGNLRIVLISPSGTPSVVLLPRPRDKQDRAFKDWPFMSVHFWGENPEGTWKLMIINDGDLVASIPGRLTNWSLIFYGTEKILSNMKSIKSMKETSEILQPSTEHYHLRGVVNHDSKAALNPCIESGKFQVIVNNQKDCLHKCPIGQYGDLKDFSCHVCDKSCLSCYGPSYNNCLSCPAKYFLLRNMCIKSCPDGFFPNTVNHQCYPCSPSCTSCQFSEEICSTCSSGLIMHDQKCIPTCPDGTYMHQETCKKCHESCGTCYGPLSSNCLSCSVGYLLYNNTCEQECPRDFYVDHGFKCSKCHRLCETCSDSSSCTKCKLNWELDFPNSCIQISHCNQDMSQGIDESETCTACYKNCERCSESNPHHCMFCDFGYFWLEGQCTKVCPDGFFAVNDECRPCSRMCHRCEHDDSNCISCKGNAFLHSGMCVSSCPLGYYNNERSECEKCHPSCLHCIDGSSFNCTSCAFDYSLINNTCQSKCPDGFFRLSHGEHNDCMPCYFTCKSCSDFGPMHCLSCYENSSHAADGACVPCLDGEFYNKDSQVCERCHDKCGRCYGPSENECLSCSAPLRLHEMKHICLPCCLDSKEKNADCCACSSDLDVCVTSDHPRSVTVSFTSPEYDEVVIPVRHIIPIIIAICASAVVLFVILFGVLQMHSAGWYTFKFRGKRYERVPSNITGKFDADMERISLTQDLEDEDDIFAKA